jgi:hypothetical protein
LWEFKTRENRKKEKASKHEASLREIGQKIQKKHNINHETALLEGVVVEKDTANRITCMLLLSAR